MESSCSNGLMGVNLLSANPTKWSSTLNLSALADELCECL